MSVPAVGVQSSLDGRVLAAVRAMNADPSTNDLPTLVYVAKRIWASCTDTRGSLLRLEAAGLVRRKPESRGVGWEET